MVGLTNGLGLERACAAYTVNLYEQTGEISDLADAVERCYYSEKYDKAVRYGEELLAADGFEAFCAERDAETAGNEDISSGYREYITALFFDPFIFTILYIRRVAYEQDRAGRTDV